MIARRELVCVRELDSGDADVLETVFAGLSAQSRYLRFHSPVNALSPDMRRRLAAGGGPDHVALGAFGGRPREPVGIVRFIAMASGRAELAVEVVDAWHGRGVGTQLLRAAKQRAAELGYQQLVAEVLAENGAVWSVLRSVFPGATTRRSGAELTVTLPVVDPVELEMADLMADLVA